MIIVDGPDYQRPRGSLLQEIASEFQYGTSTRMFRAIERGTHVHLVCDTGMGQTVERDVFTLKEVQDAVDEWTAMLAIDKWGRPAPKPGMVCTMQIGSDRYACVIERVSPSGQTFWANAPGWNKPMQVRRTEDGSWCCRRHYFFTPGVSDPYMDPSF